MIDISDQLQSYKNRTWDLLESCTKSTKKLRSCCGIAKSGILIQCQIQNHYFISKKKIGTEALNSNSKPLASKTHPDSLCNKVNVK